MAETEPATATPSKINELANNVGAKAHTVQRLPNGKSEWQPVNELQGGPTSLADLRPADRRFLESLREMEATEYERVTLIHHHSNSRMIYKNEDGEDNENFDFNTVTKDYKGDCDDHATYTIKLAQLAGVDPSRLTWLAHDERYETGKNTITVPHAVVTYQDAEGNLHILDKNLRDPAKIDLQTGTAKGQLADDFTHRTFGKPGEDVTVAVTNPKYAITPGQGGEAWRYTPAETPAASAPAPESAPAPPPPPASAPATPAGP